MKHWKQPAYHSWSSMKQRCNNPNTKGYHNYGGRGITYDPRWEFFSEFWKDMGPTWKRGKSLDRIDNNGNYCKENCRWLTNKEQCQNMRKNRTFKYDGKDLSVTEWSKLMGIPINTLWHRLQTKKWTPERTFGNGKQLHRKKVYDHHIELVFKLREGGMKQWDIARKIGVSQTVISKILKREYKYMKKYARASNRGYPQRGRK